MRQHPREGTVQDLIPRLSDLSVHSQAGTGELAARNTEINAILANLGVTADQLNTSRNDFAGVIDNLNAVSAALASNEGRALTSFISKTDTLNITTEAALGGSAAGQLDSGLKQVGEFATELNKLVATLIPESQTFDQALPACHQGLGRAPAVCVEPSDVISDNPLNCSNPAVPCGSSAGIPLRAGIDLIYEITNATSQGYGSHNFGTATQPNVQANFFLRQSAQGFELCLFEAVPCTWGQTGGSPATSQPATTSVAPTQLAPLPGGTLTPIAPQPIPKPSSGPTPTPSWSAVPSPSWSPLPTPRAAATTPTSSNSAQTSSYDIPLGFLGDDFSYQIWDVIFPGFSG